MMMNINFKKANGSLLKIFQQKNIAYHYYKKILFLLHTLI